MTSSKGHQEDNQPNNHGTWYLSFSFFHFYSFLLIFVHRFDVQCTQVAYFIDDFETVSNIAQNFTSRRIASQILPNGTLPYELARTKALWYSKFILYLRVWNYKNNNNGYFIRFY